MGTRGTRIVEDLAKLNPYVYDSYLDSKTCKLCSADAPYLKPNFSALRFTHNEGCAWARARELLAHYRQEMAESCTHSSFDWHGMCVSCAQDREEIQESSSNAKAL